MAASSRLLSLSTALQILRDPQRKSLPRIVWEAAVYRKAKGVLPRRYFKGLMYRKGMGDPRTYLDNTECRKLWNLFMRSESETLLGDKLLFNDHFKSAPGIRLPRHFGHSHQGTFHATDGTETPMPTVAELELVLGEMLDEVRAAGGSSLFAKSRKGMKGRGVFRISSSTPEPALWEALREKSYVFQQTVEQHSALTAVAPDTLNTMRITTLRRGSAEPKVVGAWIRFGRHGGIVDNASAGGLFNGVELASGRLSGPSMTKFEQGGQLYTHHPDTGHSLVGFEVPCFEAALDMARAAARHIDYPVVGWDVGVTPDGPVLIEGNSDSNYMSDETANGTGYLAHPVFGPFVREALEAARTAPPAPGVPYGPK